MLDLAPATRTLTDLVQGVRSDQLTNPTPCEAMSVGDLLDHVDGFSLAFAAAARKSPLPADAGTSVDAAHLGSDWQQRIPGRLAELADSWRDGTAWSGMTAAGGVDLPGEVAGAVALDEVIVHSWDLAVATGQPYSCPDELVQAAYGFVASAVEQNPNGTPGLFGPPVPVAADAPMLHRLIGLAGRDPGWRPATGGAAG
jgi:uncharacterized protein (TIGR03086 family)